MKRPSQHRSAILRFIAEKHIKREKFLGHISPDEEKLLDFIATVFFEGVELSVTDVIMSSHLVSSSTLHKRLHALAEAKLVEIHRTGDRRRRSVVLSEKSIRYYKAIGNLIKSIYW